MRDDRMRPPLAAGPDPAADVRPDAAAGSPLAAAPEPHGAVRQGYVAVAAASHVPAALSVRQAVSPQNLEMLQQIAARGSFAAAARAMGMVPSALTYRVRQLEDALDVLLFDRRSRRATPTEAGQALLQEAARLLADVDRIAHRIRRVATGWEPQLTLAVDGIFNRQVLLALCEQFLAMEPPTRLRLRDETLAGTFWALDAGRADLALGVVPAERVPAGVQVLPLGVVDMVFVMAPHHPLAAAAVPLAEAQIRPHRAIAVADSIPDPGEITVGLLPGQSVFTVPTLALKLQALLRGLGVGFMPRCMVATHLAAGWLIERAVQQPPLHVTFSYAWRQPVPPAMPGRALRWWLEQLAQPHHAAGLLGLTSP